MLQTLAVFGLAALVLAPISIPVSAQNNVPNRELLCNGSNCPGLGANTNIPSGRTGIVSIIIQAAQAFAFIIVGVSAFFLVYGGFLFVTDNGDGSRAKNGRAIIFNALIGMVVAILAVSIVFLVSSIVTGDLLTGLNS